MGAIREKLLWLKENDPRFKDLEIKTYHNDLTECGILIDKILEEKRIAELNESYKNIEKPSKQ